MSFEILKPEEQHREGDPLDAVTGLAKPKPWRWKLVADGTVLATSPELPSEQHCLHAIEQARIAVKNAGPPITRTP